jgi:hypothetical protein
MKCADGNGDVGVDEGAFAVCGPGDDLGKVGVEGNSGVGAGTGQKEVGDVERSVRDGDVDAEWFAAADGGKGYGVVSGFQREGECAAGGVDDAGGAGVEAAGTYPGFVGWG